MEPWRASLDEGNSEAAWDLFIELYARLIVATIRQLARDHDDTHDVFARVCEALRSDDLARLRRFVESPEGRAARFSTWLVTVVRNLTIDWLRQRDGRPRTSIPPALSPIQRQIFEHITGGYSHVEAYELICARSPSPLPFRAFLRELHGMHRVLATAHRVIPREQFGSTPLDDIAAGEVDPLPTAETSEQIAHALEALPADERLAVQLFVVDDMPAADVARTVGWPNAKAVYNRVYRALELLRLGLETQGIRRGDL